MAVGDLFDRWRKDEFFAAAEEVQESADKMESVYRLWTRLRVQGLKSDICDELGRELHTALGTAKWQLEELEAAVNLKHSHCPSEGSTIARHRQFLEAIGSQISTVENVLHDSYVIDGKRPLQWVHLDDDERDDLAIFLSAAPSAVEEPLNKNAMFDVDRVQVLGSLRCINGLKETETVNNDANYVVELEAKSSPKTKNETCSHGEQISGQRRTWSSQDIGDLKVVIADEDDRKNKVVETRTEVSHLASSSFGFLKNAEFTYRSKWIRKSLWKAKILQYLQLRRGILSYLDLKRITSFSQGSHVLGERSKSWITNCRGDSKVSHSRECFGTVLLFQTQEHGSRYYMKLNQSFRITFLLMLTIFLIVPFVLYST